MLEDCSVFVVVLSKNYCYSDYCKHEIEQARLMRKPIVIVMKEFVDECEMNGVIERHSNISPVRRSGLRKST